MKKSENISNELKKGAIIELSWSAAVLIIKLLAIAALVGDYFFCSYFKSIDQHKVMLLVVFAVFLNIYAGLHFFYICEAFVTGKKLMIKKIFRKEIDIQVDSIVKMISFPLKSIKYTIIKYKHEGKFSWALIASSNSALLEEEYFAADIIEVAKKL